MAQPPAQDVGTIGQGRRTPGIAVASLVCGLASFVCLANVLTGIPAVITGHLALGRIKRSAGALGGRGLAIAGLLLGYLSIAVTILVLVIVLVVLVPMGMAEARETACETNLREIGMACTVYATDHDGRFPERLSELYPHYLPDLKAFGCPVVGDRIESPDQIDSQTGYLYLGAGRTVYEAPSSTIIAADKPDNHRAGRRNLLYADGHVEREGGAACCPAETELEMNWD